MRYLGTMLPFAFAIALGGQAGAAEEYKFVPFPQFLSATRDANASDFVGKQNLRVKDDASFQEMRNHILSLYEGVTVKHSFLEDGRHVDCVPFEQQPSLRGGKGAGTDRSKQPSSGRGASPPAIQKGATQP